MQDHLFYLNKETPEKHITISIGFASFDEESDIYRLLNLADRRLYEAKQAGKNRVIAT